MNKFINMAEKAFYVVLVSLGAIFILSAFLGSSMLNMVTRLFLGGTMSICGLLELIPDFFKSCLQKSLLVIRLILISSYAIQSGITKKFKSVFIKRKRRTSNETDLIKTSRIQRH